MTSQPSSSAGNSRDIFATTHWTVVLAAGQQTTPQSAVALEELCQTYWYPLYVYVRRRGHSREDAEDLTQAFFARLLKNNDFANVNAERGRFRAFLLAALKHFLANEWDKSQRQKRGGGLQVLSLDWQTADTQFHTIADHQPSPDQAFDREWALILLSKVIARLQTENKDEERHRQFNQLKTFLTTNDGESSYRDAASRLEMDETAVRVAVHRLRKRYRQLLKEEICQTLSNPADLAEEIRALFKAFA